MAAKGIFSYKMSAAGENFAVSEEISPYKMSAAGENFAVSGHYKGDFTL